MLSASMSNQGLNASSTGGGCHAPRQGRDCGSLLMQTVRMTRQKILMKKNLLLLLSLVILGSTALVLCTRAQACKLTPEAYDLSAYLSSDQPNKVVFQAEDGIRDPLWSRGLGDVYKRQGPRLCTRVRHSGLSLIAPEGFRDKKYRGKSFVWLPVRRG